LNVHANALISQDGRRTNYGTQRQPKSMKI
jgi:hypothetical protein